MDTTTTGAHGPAHAEPNYIAVFFVLFVLTVLELAVAYFHFLPKAAIAAMLVILALVKAACVGAYFMHLKFEKRTLIFIATTPLVLCVFLVFMLLPDAK